jgi:hypothetical protein
MSKGPKVLWTENAIQGLLLKSETAYKKAGLKKYREAYAKLKK